MKITLLEKEWSVSSFSKLQTCIQINKNIKVKNKTENTLKINLKINKNSLHHVCFHGGLFNEFSSRVPTSQFEFETKLTYIYAFCLFCLVVTLSQTTLLHVVFLVSSEKK